MITDDAPDVTPESSKEPDPRLVREPGQPLGRVASPLRQESTSSRFHFWVPRDTLAEKTHLVHTVCKVGGHTIDYYGSVEEVYRRSRKRSMDEEVDTFDGEIDYEPPFGLEGVTFAEVSILRTDPPFMTPPLEQSVVRLAGPVEAGRAYAYDAMQDLERGVDWRLPVGLLRNGGSAFAGVACIDLRDLTGDRAGHLNATGQAGRGTKSSFLLFVVRSLIDRVASWDDGNPQRDPFSVRPIVFNVKGDDLMYIDAPNRLLTPGQLDRWAVVGLAPRAFEEAVFSAPCRGGAHGVNRGLPRVHRPVHPDRQTKTYFWTLADVVRLGLWQYLFSDTAQQSETMMSLADHILGLIAEPCTAGRDHSAGLQLRSDGPQSFEELGKWLRDALKNQDHAVRDNRIHAFATIRALLSRLNLALGREGSTIFHDGPGDGQPLDVANEKTSDPVVIDIAALPTELRRFVVASVLDQVKEHQTGDLRIPGRVYFLVLDELGIYAPRGATDPITRLFEHVAAQLRSQGIILLGAQQHASKVSETIVGNSETKALGATSPQELESSTWSHLLTPAQKNRALMLGAEEKMVLGSRGWMNVIVPFPAWAMKKSEADFSAMPSADTSGGNGPNGHGSVSAFPLNLPEQRKP
jgi:uncharacterized protein